MATDHPYAGITRVVEISSNIGTSCDHCDTRIGGGWGDDGFIQDSINHYIHEHGYRLLHAGTETHHGGDGNPWHSTIAILGAANPPPLKPEPGPIEARIRPPKNS
jgi:hypothetical protein